MNVKVLVCADVRCSEPDWPSSSGSSVALHHKQHTNPNLLPDTPPASPRANCDLQASLIGTISMHRWETGAAAVLAVKGIFPVCHCELCWKHLWAIFSRYPVKSAPFFVNAISWERFWGFLSNFSQMSTLMSRPADSISEVIGQRSRPPSVAVLRLYSCFSSHVSCFMHFVPSPSNLKALKKIVLSSCFCSLPLSSTGTRAVSAARCVRWRWAWRPTKALRRSPTATCECWPPLNQLPSEGQSQVWPQSLIWGIMRLFFLLLYWSRRCRPHATKKHRLQEKMKS